MPLPSFLRALGIGSAPAEAELAGPDLLARAGWLESPVWAALIAHAPFGLAICDRDGRLVAWNAAFARLAAPASEAIAPGTALAELVEAADQDSLLDGLDQGLRGPLGDAQRDARFRHAPDYIASLTISGVLDGSGARVGVSVRAVDVTGPRQFQRQLAQAAKMQAVGQLAGGLAHDFNNLLTAIMGATDLMLGRGELVEADRADLVHVRRAAERGAGLVRQLLAFSRRQTLRPTVIDLSAAVADIAPILTRLLGERIRIEMDLERPGRLVRVDPVQLDQVIVNLAANARDAMPDGGALVLRTGHLSVMRPLPLGSEVMPAGRYVVLEVADSGQGIAPEHLGRIFEPFFTTKEKLGTGLGLATVYGIVRQTEGYIAVESAPGQGASFRIYLPRYEGAEPAANLGQSDDTAGASPARFGPAVAAAPARARGTLLLAEDEDAVRELARRALSDAGWTVIAAASAEEALERAPPDLAGLTVLVSDVAMPGLDGPELARQLRLGRPDLPVVLMSGYAETARLGIVPGQEPVLLAKPFALRDLVETVGRVCAPPMRTQP
ncbi:MAG: response regulator [Alphaproteobacteria bacterium]|nr:response regulator [Alphaproteobacteria bacterium]